MGQKIRSSARSLHAVRDIYGQYVGNSVATGVDLSNIMGVGTKYWGKMIINDESMGVSQLLGAHPGCSPKSTLMSVATCGFQTAICLFKDVTRKTVGGWSSGAFLLILGKCLGTSSLV